MRKTPAIVFDLDGTLVDTAPDLLGALNAVLVRHSRPRVNTAALRHLVGHGARVMLAEAMRLTGEEASEAALPGLVDEFIVHYRAHIADESILFPNVETTLTKFLDVGARLAVLTNKPHELTVQLLPALNLDRYFAVVCGAGRLSFNKPDARVFHHVVEELGGTGSGAIMIGDSPTDVATARAAGVKCVVLTYGYTPVPPHELGGDAVLDDFAELPDVVARLLA